MAPTMALPLPLAANAGRETCRNAPARGEPHLTGQTHRRDEKAQETDANLSSRSFSLKAALPRLKAKLRSFKPLKTRAKRADERSSRVGASEYMSPTTAEACSDPIDASLLRQKLLQVQRSQGPPRGKDADDKREQTVVVSTDEGSAASPKGLFPRMRRWCWNRQRGLPEGGRRRARRAPSPEWIHYCSPGSRFYGL
ncbi:hypothetical protein BBK36DRAFT_1194792 [Trichoderma citrinoviride]|uniref:Uncharacterized protein n=1 Tax=Trichoderma citrinoviride TaxID=58853 RepID=A0A2T4BFG4_9HYPO|nr:hypothetical protein BBK36DRAFT_1194792 [Trichoderma citrinoviride]PTB68067.1 hypothetical protein BBK36DRAFT_1194792 [Trichoderma citrinoviride]